MSHFISRLCLVFCALRLLPRLLSLRILCIMSLALFRIFACFVYCISYFVSCLLGFRSRSSEVNLLVFLLYIVSFDKQSYIELAVN